MRRRRRSNGSWFWFLILNIFVSAATTLTVLTLWDRQQNLNFLPPIPLIEPAVATLPAPSATAALPAQPTLTPTTAATGPQVEVAAVVGATDLRLEYVLLRRIGSGDVNLAGWTISDQDNHQYTFPAQPALVLFPGGQIQLFSRSGEDTPTEIFWNLEEPVWQSGEWVIVSDATGAEQARYRIP